jgi:predicted ATPase
MGTEAQARATGLESPQQDIPTNRTLIRSVEIKRFRCFREAKIDGLRRINVIVGGSGSGKTAFLEAIFMCAGTEADVFLRTQGWRGAAWLASTQITTGGAFRDIWREMFFNFDDSKRIAIEFSVAAAHTRSLNVYYGASEDLGPVALNPAVEEAAPIVLPLKFEGHTESGVTFRGPVTIGPRGRLMYVRPSVRPYPMAFLSPAALLDSQIIANLFSELSIREQHEEVVEAVRKLFPFVVSLSVEIQGGSNAIFASIRGLPEKLYVGSVSAGIGKFLAILLVVASQSGGAVAVDELENGLYYGNLVAVWKSIVGFCRSRNTQLFVTTHSLECLRAMLPTIAEAPEDFCLLRAERENGECQMRVFDGEHFEAALQENLEIR